MIRSRTGTVVPGTKDSFFRINDLADRRNEVAHGQPSELLSASLLLEYISVVRTLCHTLFDSAILSIMPFAQRAAIAIGSPCKVLRSGYAACFELTIGTELHVNDTIVAYSGDCAFRSGPVLSIQVNGSDRDTVLTHEGRCRP